MPRSSFDIPPNCGAYIYFASETSSANEASTRFKTYQKELNHSYIRAHFLGRIEAISQYHERIHAAIAAILRPSDHGVVERFALKITQILENEMNDHCEVLDPRSLTFIGHSSSSSEHPLLQLRESIENDTQPTRMPQSMQKLFIDVFMSEPNKVPALKKIVLEVMRDMQMHKQIATWDNLICVTDNSSKISMMERKLGLEKIVNVLFKQLESENKNDLKNEIIIKFYYFLMAREFPPEASSALSDILNAAADAFGVQTSNGDFHILTKQREHIARVPLERWMATKLQEREWSKQRDALDKFSCRYMYTVGYPEELISLDLGRDISQIYRWTQNLPTMTNAISSFKSAIPLSDFFREEQHREQVTYHYR